MHPQVILVDVVGAEEVADAGVPGVVARCRTGCFCGAHEEPAWGLICTGPISSKQTTTAFFGGRR